jgi:hypothetical protein
MSVSNEGQFTLEAEKVFRSSLSTHGSGMTEIYNMGFHTLALLAVHVCL